jgi:hypothetical protein
MMIIDSLATTGSSVFTVFPSFRPSSTVLAENAHPFENPPLRINDPFGLLGLAGRFLSGRFLRPGQQPPQTRYPGSLSGYAVLPFLLLLVMHLQSFSFSVCQYRD